MKVKLLFFGITEEMAGCRERETEAAGDLDGLKEQLFREIPALRGMSLVFAVNDRIVQDNVALKEGDEIAVMPPFAGG